MLQKILGFLALAKAAHALTSLLLRGAFLLEPNQVLREALAGDAHSGRRILNGNMFESLQ